ncbi:hypothetical protein [Nonomuraea rubra]|uniref:Uncharacterized protein n=1 Tax=Nonomuraea rubra TaxID=46180 RepID=A0A7X0P2T2_9ACTN|nr:hypothetical protein [Nonomuraea rubra]MBB6554231.1 hypothetical protein [Nonomuraea rubra]
MRFVVTDARITYEADREAGVAEMAMGVLLTFELSGFDGALIVLAAIDDILSGRSAREVHEFGPYRVDISREGVVFTRTFGKETEEQVRPVSVLKEAAERYWELLLAHRNHRRPGVTYFYRPDLPLAWAELLSWEEGAKRAHPYRGRLGIPAVGPV